MCSIPSRYYWGFQTSSAMLMRSALFWDIRGVVLWLFTDVSGQRMGPILVDLVYFPSWLLQHFMHSSPIIFTLLHWQRLDRHETGSRPGIRLATLRVSPPPSLTLFWFFLILIYLFLFLLFYFYFIYLALYLYFPPLPFSIPYMFFPTLSWLHSRYF
jgi:hypothetical protein